MSVHVKLINYTNGEDPALLARRAEDVLRELPDVPVQTGPQSFAPRLDRALSLSTLREILSYLEPDAPYGEWRDCVAAIRATPILPDADLGELRRIAHEFSDGRLDRRQRYVEARPRRYSGPDAVDRVFDTMPPKNGGVGFGTLVKAARDAGYTGIINGDTAQEIFAHHERDGTPEHATDERRKFRVFFPRDMKNLPEPRYVVDGIIPDCAVTLIYGAPGSCKSFLVLDLLASIAHGGLAFNKFCTIQGDAILCAGEAPYGAAQKRWPAWCNARGIKNPDDVGFLIVPAVPIVSDRSEIEALMDSIEAAGAHPRIVALDTVARSIAGRDESDASTAGLVTEAAERIRDRFNCAIALVHHSGKDREKGARGSSAFEANADAVFEVTRDKERGIVSLKCTKMKDADELEPIHLKEERYGDSLVLNWIAKDEHGALTRKNAGPSRTDVGAALRRLGSDVATRPLAVELAGPGATEAEVCAMVRLLQHKAKDVFRGYVIHHGTGGRDGTVWGLRPDESKELSP